MKFSVILPVYKVEKYLRTCIERVQAQSYTNWALILMGDGSLYKGPEIC